ncbi:MAG: molybdopterin-dependent oxidoreductase [Planctomycetes bacterium]|nr:molybdopterin-dependent oxidoreductase [Planctomycetota bacterium]
MSEVRASVCPLDCPDRCALDVTVDGDRIIKIDGSKRSPFTDGYICAKVRNFDRRLDSERRVLHPMRRRGKKGSGEFENITWDDAISEIAAKFKRIVSESGPQSIVPYSYSGSNGLLTSHAMDERFWNRLGASQLSRTLCAANTGAAWTSVFEDMPGSDPAEIVDSDAIVLWGVNPSASGIHLVPLVREARKRGAWVGAIDPRRTPLASIANAHLAVYPGTDVVVALAMANIAFKENLVDAAFLQKNARGIESLQKAAAEWPPQRASKLARVDAGAIVDTTRAIARARAPFFRVGWGLERNRNGTDAVRAVLMLRCLFGKFNKKGAGAALSTTKGYRMDLARAEGAHLRKSPARSLNMSKLGEFLENGASPPVRALFIYNCNPVATAPNQSRIERALAKDSLYTICHEQVFTDTCSYADLVLPATTFLEHHELSRSYGGYALQWGAPVTKARGLAKPNHWLFARLAEAMGFTENEFKESEAEIARAAVESSPDKSITFDALVENTYIPIGARKPFVNVFPSRGFADLAGAAPPRYREAPADAEKAIVLISPCTDKAISSTLYEQTAPGGGFIMISAADASARNLVNGSVARVWNSVGEVEIRVAIREDLPPGVAMIPKGYWKHATLNGFTANALAPDHVDELGGGACFNDARVEIELLTSVPVLSDGHSAGRHD